MKEPKEARRRCLLRVAALSVLLAAPFGQRAQAAPPTGSLENVTTATSPTDIVHVGDGRLFIVEQGGLVRIFPEGGGSLTTFLNISGLVSGGSERGLLSLAFHPDYSQNGFFYVSYTATGGGASVIERYTVSADPDVADAGSGVIFFGPFPQPASNHNGGRIQFDAQGRLTFALGDGGGGGDPSCFAQNDATPLGKLIRLGVDEMPVTFEVLAKGLRNPWRFSYDRVTQDLYIGDVGQGTREEISFHAAGTPFGENYGWKVMEGTSCHDPDPIDPDCPAGTPSCFSPVYTPPIVDYANAGGDCAVTGGYVYRGIKSIPYGVYFYGDFCSGQVWTLEQTSPGVWTNTPFIDGGFSLRTFGEDVDGELYAAFGDQIVRFVFDGPDRQIPVGALPMAWRAGFGLVLLAALTMAARAFRLRR